MLSFPSLDGTTIEHSSAEMQQAEDLGDDGPEIVTMAADNIMSVLEILQTLRRQVRLLVRQGRGNLGYIETFQSHLLQRNAY